MGPDQAGISLSSLSVMSACETGMFYVNEINVLDWEEVLKVNVN